MIPKPSTHALVALSLAAASAATRTAPQAAPARQPHLPVSVGDDQLLRCNGNGSAITPGGLIRLDPATFAGTLITDSVSPGGLSGLGFAFGPLDLALLPPPNGVVLCDIFTPPGLFTTVINPPSGGGPSTPFTVPVTDACALVGVTLCVQGAYVEAAPAGKISLTNALDITLGSF